ncbi:MAG: hypothetical protein FWF94_00875 [Oscillospiraceae bacterium]|nr:hypothetical protein [Oscillospiraceae bacterium]
MKKIFVALIISVIVSSFIAGAGASTSVVYSDTNRNITILNGEFAGYKFAPADDVDPSQIAKIKYYIKVETPIEDLSGTTIELAYNSDTTGWVNLEHDLEDGLITEMDVESEITEDDLFEAGLINWNEGVTGTFSLELLDESGNVIGPSAIGEAPAEETTAPEVQETAPEITPTVTPAATPAMSEQTAEEPIQGGSITKSPNVRDENVYATTPAIVPPSANAARTGRTNIITAAVMSVISICAIASMRKAKK